MSSYPEPSFEHLFRLSDSTGLFEHARGAVPRREHGYCVDDVARGLMVICREPAPSTNLIDLAERYLAFVLHAQAADGGFHNRLGYDRRWADEPGTGDWWGRALWGLGTAAACGPVARVRQGAFEGFELGARCRSRWPRAMAFAGLGAADVLRVRPDHAGARRLLADAVMVVGRPGADPDWPWPEPRLTYANATVAELLLAAGHQLADDSAAEAGRAMLAWLCAVQTYDGHLSLVPVGGWQRGEPRPGFDQQPIEAAALADACARALALTGDPVWAERLELAAGWFVGDNDAKVSLRNPVTRGGGDGLEPDGRNANEGAESTLALLSTLQHVRPGGVGGAYARTGRWVPAGRDPCGREPGGREPAGRVPAHR